MDDRESILGTLPDASGGSAPSIDLRPSPAPTESGTFDLSKEKLWELFEARLLPLGGKIASLKDLEALQGKHVAIDEDALVQLEGVNLVLATSVWDAEVGITMADSAVAETGSLLLSARPGRQRLASLAPPIHVALVKRDSIVGTLEEAIDKLSSRTSVLITGPSRTADIEGVLVRGVHGPKELWVLPL